MDELGSADSSPAVTCSVTGTASPTAILGTDHVDGEEPSVKVDAIPSDVTAEFGMLGVNRGFPVDAVLIFGGSGGTGGRSFGTGGRSRTSRIPFAPTEVQLEEPEKESEPSIPVGSVVLPRLADCCVADGRESPLGSLL
jgi:hypothetical protein